MTTVSLHSASFTCGKPYYPVITKKILLLLKKKHSTFNYGQRLRLDISFPVFAPEYQRVEEKGGALIDLVNYRNMLSVDMNAALILYIIVLYIIATGHLELVFATDSCIQAPCRPFYQPSLR